MRLTGDIRHSIDRSVLCWLATVSEDLIPNVSPKEIFTYFGEDTIIIANIASPQTMRNLQNNKNACVSFIDVLVQKGYQVKGQAEIIKKGAVGFMKMEEQLLILTGGKFPFSSIIRIQVQSVRPIIAPKYILYPETTEQEQIASAKKMYGI